MIPFLSLYHTDCLSITQFIAEDEKAFDELYCVAFEMLDVQWLEMRASYMEFNVSLFEFRRSWNYLEVAKFVFERCVNAGCDESSQDSSRKCLSRSEYQLCGRHPRLRASVEEMSCVL